MIATLCLTAFLCIAVLTDLTSRKIPNELTVGGLILGLALSATGLNGPTDITQSILGTLVGFVFLLPFYAVGKMGAGDIKLLAMAGSFLGLQSIVVAGLCTLLAGGGLAVVWVLLQKWIRNTYMVSVQGNQCSLDHNAAAIRDSSSGINANRGVINKLLIDSRYPYALAIAAGIYLSTVIQLT